MTVSLNFDPERLLVLPPPDEDGWCWRGENAQHHVRALMCVPVLV
jgi:hypothetical protein